MTEETFYGVPVSEVMRDLAFKEVDYPTLTFKRSEFWKNLEKEMEKFKSPCPPPTPYQRELLEILIEECAEVQQRATKMLRFGVEEVQPGQDLNNAERLSLEFGDLREIGYRCQQEGLILTSLAEAGRYRKRLQLQKFMQTERESDGSDTNAHNG